MNNLRILSLLPAATEMVYLLGLEKYLVGVSHECDYPAQVKVKPQVTSSDITNKLSSGEIDKRVKLSLHRGPGAFHIKEEVLKKLRPNLILTQELCQVCAVGFDQVQKAARILSPTSSVILRSGATKDLKISKAESRDSSLIARNDNVAIISLEPESVEDILENILLIGKETDKEKEARKKILSLRSRMTKVSSRLAKARSNRKPKVLVVEWLDPIMVAGHWVPEMVEIAGGRNLLTKPESRSKIVTINQIISSKPDMLVISPCGFDIKRSVKEKNLIKKIARGMGEIGVYLVDGNAYMTRPGPRIVNGIEILAEVFNHELPRKYNKKDWTKLSS